MGNSRKQAESKCRYAAIAQRTMKYVFRAVSFDMGEAIDRILRKTKPSDHPGEVMVKILYVLNSMPLNPLHQDILRLMYEKTTFAGPEYEGKNADVEFVKRAKVVDLFWNRFVCPYLMRTRFPHLNVVKCVDKDTGLLLHGDEYLEETMLLGGVFFKCTKKDCKYYDQNAKDLKYLSTVSRMLTRAATGVSLKSIQFYDKRETYKVAEYYPTLKADMDGFITKIIQIFDPLYRSPEEGAAS